MYKEKRVVAVVLAAGKGTRIGFDKMLYKIFDESIVRKSVLAFENNEYIDEIIITASENIKEIQKEVEDLKKVVKIIQGGSTRSKSVKNAMEFVLENSLVAIHDGARPFVSDSLINSVIQDAYDYKAAVPCVLVKDTIKFSQNGFCEKTLNRDNLYITQTPQVFCTNTYKDLLLKNENTEYTDDAQLFEANNIEVKISKGKYENYKITTIDDIKNQDNNTAQFADNQRGNVNMRIGHGYDVHRLVEGRDLILGGVKIPHKKGLLGHSDADVLTHVIMDSMIGALALGDIGKHFPDDDDKYKGASSVKLLEHVVKLIDKKGYEVQNIDATIVAQNPKLSPFIDKMRENLAKTLRCDINDISVKATTEEKLSFTGAEDGICAHCVCLLKQK